MKKQQPVAARGGRAGIHLPGTSARRLEPDDVPPRQAKRRERRILWRRDNDDFGIRPVRGLERPRKRFSIAVNRNDDADRHHGIASSYDRAQG